MPVHEDNTRKTITLLRGELELFLAEAAREGFNEKQFSQWAVRCFRERVRRNRGSKSLDAPLT